MARQPKHEPHIFAKDPPHGVIFHDGNLLLTIDAKGDIVLYGEQGEENREDGGLGVWPSDLNKTSSAPPEAGDENKQSLFVYLNTKEGPRIVSVTADLERKKLLSSTDLHLTEKGWRPIDILASSVLLTPDLIWQLINFVEGTDKRFPQLIRVRTAEDSSDAK